MNDDGAWLQLSQQCHALRRVRRINMGNVAIGDRRQVKMEFAVDLLHPRPGSETQIWHYQRTEAQLAQNRSHSQLAKAIAQHFRARRQRFDDHVPEVESRLQKVIDDGAGTKRPSQQDDVAAHAEDDTAEECNRSASSPMPRLSMPYCARSLA